MAGALALSGGGSGLLSVPDAGLLPADTVVYQHTNGILPFTQARESLSRRAFRTGEALTDHIQLSVLPRTEFGARLSTWYEEGSGRRQLNDLSGHFKWQAWNGSRVRVALGSRDFAGEGENLAPAEFVVADLRGSWWQVVAGYGRSDIEGAALDGVFGGLRVAPRRWLDVLVDHDGAATNYGFRLHAGVDRFAGYVQAHGTTFDAQDVVWAAGVSYRLGDDSRRVPTDLPAREQPPSTLPDTRRLEFLDLRDGADELAAQLGAQAQAQSHCVSLLATAQRVPLLRAACSETPVDLRWQTHWRQFSEPGDQAWWPRLHLRLEPSTRYAVGTEYGRLDYAWAMRGSAALHAPLGLGAYGVWDVPAGNTEEYAIGGAFARSRYESGLFEAGVQWTWHLLPGVFAQASAGQSTLQARDLDFTRGELAGLFLGGRLGLSYSYTAFDTVLPRVADEQTLWRGFLWLSAPRYALEYTGGTHLYADKGQRWDLYRYIGRTRVGLYLKDGEGQRAVGMTLSVPLTPRRAIGNRWVGLSGTAHFTPNLETQIDTDNGRNNLRPNFLRSFTPQRNLIEDVLDQWRYSPHYLSRR